MLRGEDGEVMGRMGKGKNKHMNEIRQEAEVYIEREAEGERDRES